MHFVYVGDFRENWSTEEYVALALERTGNPCHRIQGDHYRSLHILRVCMWKAAEYGARNVCCLFAKGGHMADTPSRKSRYLLPPDKCRFLWLCRELRDAGIQTAVWYWDLLASEFDLSRFAWAERAARAVDVFFLTDGYTAPRLPNSYVLRQGFPGPTDYPSRGCHDLGLANDATFIGGLYGARREWWTELAAVAGRYNLRLRHVRGIRGDDLFNVCRTARVVLGPPWPDYPGYWSNRIYVAAGYGGCYAGPTVAGMEAEGWRPWENYLPLERPGDLKTLLELIDGELRTVADNGQRFVFANHTYDHRVKEMVRVLEGISGCHYSKPRLLDV